MSEKIGIFGGTFDPIHFGHLSCARAAYVSLKLDSVMFIPARISSFKQDRELASIEDRLEMCRLATQDIGYFSVSEIEARRTGVSYTADTLQELHGAYPSSGLYFIVGADMIRTLAYWAGADRLKSLAKYVCIMRPGTIVDDGTKHGLESCGFDVCYVDARTEDISSSDIRMRCRRGEDIYGLAPDKVCRYIEAHRLYSAGD